MPRSPSVRPATEVKPSSPLGRRVRFGLGKQEFARSRKAPLRHTNKQVQRPLLPCVSMLVEECQTTKCNHANAPNNQSVRSLTHPTGQRILYSPSSPLGPQEATNSLTRLQACGSVWSRTKKGAFESTQDSSLGRRSTLRSPKRRLTKMWNHADVWKRGHTLKTGRTRELNILNDFQGPVRRSLAGGEMSCRPFLVPCRVSNVGVRGRPIQICMGSEVGSAKSNMLQSNNSEVGACQLHGEWHVASTSHN